MPLREDILNPVPGDNPSGENLRYAPVYDQIKEARREDDDVPQGDWQIAVKKADWVVVIKLAGDALATRSKDLQLAAWLTEAMLQREGFAGLEAGLGLLRGLIENFWDTVYPELEDGDAELRAVPLDWVGSRLDKPIKNVALTRGGLDWFKYKESRTVPTEDEAAASESRLQARTTAIEEGKLTPEAFDADFNTTPAASYETWESQLAGCLEAAGALKAAVEEKFTDYVPSFSELERTLEEVKNTVRILRLRKGGGQPAQESPQREEDAAPAPEPAAYGAAAAAAPARRKTSAGPEPADREDACERVAALARFLREQDAANPAPYLMLRGLRWGELRAAGEGYDPDSSLLEAPPTATRQALKRLAGESEWQQVLDTAETAMGTPCGRAWLDLQRYAATACDNLGYYAAAWAIKSEVRALLSDLPRLLDMSLSDDTPVANGETRTWLKEFLTPAAAPYSQPSALEASDEEALGTEDAPDAFQLALDAARSGQVRDAIEILNREAAQEPSGRGRFRRRVQLAQVCMGAGEEAIALPILEELASEIERRKLEEWEPSDLIAQALSLLYRSMEKNDASAEEKQKIYGRVCRLDPVEALALRR
ncbi:MAG TPA: type VI secretion system protein TssA [Bryobacteraceae bacterium]|nr:type VI secretion system protein TssA [Bryobacteraceae bacterium]